jgi:hypothetical protein
MVRNSWILGSTALVGTILATLFAVGSCGSQGGSTDGGVRQDGGSVLRPDGGGTDGGVRTDGGTIRPDGGAGGCTVNHDCNLSQRCESTTHQCVNEQGGVGTSCPNGTECAQDNVTACLGPLPNGDKVCTRECTGDSDCPRPFTCQTVGVSVPDGGSQTIQVCLAPDAMGTICRNERDNCNPQTDANFCVDPSWECTVQGQLCMPSSATSPTGNCVPGDNCNFAAQTGCSGNDTCHPAGAFYLDNNQGTFCASSGSGQQGASCSSLSDCAKGYVCAGSVGCLKYCTPGSPNACQGVTRADGGVAQCLDILTNANGAPLPDAVRSIPVGVCY